MLIEDDVDSREALSLFLEQEGYEVAPVGSAGDGLERLREGGVDLVLTDYMLPDRSGAWLIERAGAEGLLGGAPVLMLSAHPDPELAAGVKLLRKPLDLDGLLHEIESQLGPGRRAAGARAPVEAPRAEFALYVTAHSVASRRALRNVERVLRDWAPGQVALAVRDVAQCPDEAAADQIDFTPALVRHRPGPRLVLLGDLREARALEELLHDAGVEPSR